MTLGFMQKWPKEMGMQDDKTYFIEKINLGLLKSNQSKAIDYVESLEDYRSRFGGNWDTKENLKPKIHTIRKDESERWKPGMKIHFVVNNRTPNRFQFAAVVQCSRVQNIEIVRHKSKTHHLSWIVVKIDNRELSEAEIKTLAINDGFDSVGDFFKYFIQDFKGKLIIWDDIKY